MTKMATCIQKIRNWFLSENTAFVFLLLSPVLLVGFIFYHPSDNAKYTEGVGALTGGIVACLISIANAILLYLTLNSQKKGILNQKTAFRQERFENTFFNLLEYHRKLTDSLHIKVKYLNEDLQIVYVDIRGRNFFDFANKELQFIQESIASDYYKGKYDELEDCKDYEAIEQELCVEDPEGLLFRKKVQCLKQTYHQNRIKFANLLYGITKEKWADLHASGIFQLSSYRVFYDTMFSQYEHYIRSLQTLVEYSKKGHNEQYAKFIYSQMTNEEFAFVNTHSLFDNSFKESIKTIL